MSYTFDENLVLLVSAPKDILLQAEALVERQSGYYATCLRDDSRHPQRKSFLSVLGQLIVLLVSAKWAEAGNLLGEFAMSWMLRYRWELGWKGAVIQGIGMLKQNNPTRMVYAVVIEGGEFSDWEQEQLSPGGELWKICPETQLIVFHDLDEFGKVWVCRESSANRHRKFDNQMILLVSAPEHALLQAKAHVERQGGFCAAFIPSDPRSPKRKTVLSVLGQLLILLYRANYFEACNLLREPVMSWTLKHRWKSVWKGGVLQGIGMLKHDNPTGAVHAVAIKGGKQCDWEQQQLAPGGEVWMKYPGTQLSVFQNLDEFEQVLRI